MIELTASPFPSPEVSLAQSSPEFQPSSNVVGLSGDQHQSFLGALFESPYLHNKLKKF